MSTLTLQNASLTLANQVILNQVNWQIEPKSRIALVGRNGAGKSTFLKVLSEKLALDKGQLIKSQGTTIAILEQEVPKNAKGTVLSFLLEGLGEVGEALKVLHNSHACETEIANAHQVIDAHQGFELMSWLQSMATRLYLDLESNIEDLSGGMKRRVLLGQALLAKPSLLLLDEPTNHLDLPSIEWLEQILKRFEGAVLFVTHDRTFLSATATGILELDRGALHTYPGDYETFLERKAERIDAEQKANALFDKRLADEEVWIRTGIKARRTRNEGRVRALKALRLAYAERRHELGKVKTVGLDVKTSGMIVIDAQNVSFQYEPQSPLIKDLSLLITKGDKLGIIGPNGSGKSTLLKLLLGDISPLQGEIKRGTSLDIAYFDQLRDTLVEQATVLENVADGATHVTINGQNKHVASYLKDFLFSPEKFNQPVSTLSGGERNRLLLAKLLAKPVNLLVMDEPTNDLDIETLEMLEDMLRDYKGTLLLISHDRAFVNEVVTSVLVFEGEGQFGEYLGGYRDYELAKKDKKTPPIDKAPEKQKRETQKLSYNEQRELKNLPAQIEKCENEIAKMHEEMASGDFYQQSPEKVASHSRLLQDKELELATLYARWEALEERG